MDEIFSNNIISYLEEKLKEFESDYALLFNDLKERFNAPQLSFCFKYILENSRNTALLDKTIREINKTRFKENLAPLIDFILNPNKDETFLGLKVLAIKTISNYKDTTAVSSLMYCLNNKDSNYKIRLAAAEALGKIGDKNAFESLTNVVYDEKEKSTYIKESAVIALGMLGDTRALDVFNSIMDTKQMFLDKFSYLKERMLEAISKFDISKDKKTIDVLKKTLLDRSPRIRIAAIETIMNSDLANGYELIYDRLISDDDIEVKKNALVALYNISDERILKEVIKGEFSFELKKYAKEILDQYGEDNE